MLTVFAFVLAALLPAGARGDAVPPPPTDCPPGSEGGTGHCGTYCMPKACTDWTACASGTVCKETKLCIEQKTCSGGKPTPYDFKVPPYIRDEVKGSCVTATCQAGSCRSISVCMPKAAIGDSPTAKGDSPTAKGDSPAVSGDKGTGGSPNRGCSCSLAEASCGAGALLSLLLALGLAARSRRGREARRQ